jgi:hypothetical protein
VALRKYRCFSISVGFVESRRQYKTQKGSGYYGEKEASGGKRNKRTKEIKSIKKSGKEKETEKEDMDIFQTSDGDVPDSDDCGMRAGFCVEHHHVEEDDRAGN